MTVHATVEIMFDPDPSISEPELREIVRRAMEDTVFQLNKEQRDPSYQIKDIKDYRTM